MSENITKDEIEQVVEATVDAILTRLGVDTEDPIELQRDMQFVRDWRKSTEAVKGKALVTIISVLVCGTAGALFLGVKTLLLRQ